METKTNETKRRVKPGHTLRQWMAYALWANDIIPNDAGFFAIASECEADGERRSDESPEMKDFNRRYDEASARYREDGCPDWESGAFVPDEIKAFDDELRRMREEAAAEIMRERGQSDMADLFMNNRAEYDRRYDAGCAYFYAADYDAWKSKKLEGVTVTAGEMVDVLTRRTDNEQA